LLAERQEVPIILEGGDRSREGTSYAHCALLGDANGLLKWIASDVVHQGEVERDERQDPALCSWLGHGVVHLPVLVADRRGCRAGEVVEDLSRRFVGLSG